MSAKITRLSIASCCSALVLGSGILAAAHPKPAAPRIEYNRDIRPILSDKCFACHGPDSNKRMAGLRLDTEQGARAGAGGRSAVIPGKPTQSPLLIRATTPKTGLRMPPVHTGKTLTAREMTLLSQWIAQGGKYQAHWAYLPPRKAPAPTVKQATWARGPVDRFILARIQAAGRKPSPEADRVTLIRRLSLDLTGIPPTPAEVDVFLADRSPQAYEKVVDRLLASPRYGERMAMYWLDLVRYADTVGYHGDQEHHISPYRDWVIKAFHDNMPYNRFTVEQLAGDLLPNPTMNQRIATGYNRLLQTTHEGGAQDKEYLAKYAADRIRNLSGVWLGATVGCAECHDHKYDPYRQKDFYSLAAFFADIQEQGAFSGADVTPTRRAPEIDVLSPFDQEEIERLNVHIEQLKSQAPDAAAQNELATLQKRAAELSERKRRTMVTVAVAPRVMRVLRRGDWMDEGGEVVSPSTPAFLKQAAAQGSRPTRLDLARWLTSPGHPLTARVWVNRVWSQLFGAGLCRSLDDFGAQGEWPTHPELLDHLAVTFVESGWDTKRLVKTLVMSSTYRQSSAAPADVRARDPENRLFARQARFRLPAEMIRDSALSTSGLLVERLGGPSARPYQPDGYYDLLNFPRRSYQHQKDENQYRRGVYVHWQRQYLHPMLKAFDAPSREECTAQRPITNTPLASLTLLNDPSFVEAARVLAARVLREGGTGDATRVRWLWRVVLSRAPSEREVAALLRLHHQSLAQYRADRAEAAKLVAVGLAPVPTDLDVPELAAWTASVRVLLNLNETITRN